MLAIWRIHGVDTILREAWTHGAVLAGVSAGGLCWFESGVTDSFGRALAPLDGMLGFLGGSFCPHYDGEVLRRPRLHELVAAGRLPATIACDDGVAAVYRGTELTETVSERDGASAYRVELVDGEVRETALPTRRLP
jgi:peptidase E